MSFENIRNASFPNPTYDKWVAEAEKALKGKPLESLQSETLEGIMLQPLYTKEMVEEYRDRSATAVRSTLHNGGWTISQDVFADNASDYLTLLKDSLSKGNETIVYKGYGFDWTEEQLQELAQLVTQYPIHFYIFNDQDPIVKAFDFVQEKEKVNGYISYSPVLSSFVGLKSIIDTTAIHYDGANAVQELATALFLASKAENNLGRMAVRFQVDTHFFMEIAKLRAFRILWTALCQAYGKESEPIKVLAETSLRSFSKVDPDVNLLRSGNIAFSAAIGGADLITVHPHSILTGATDSSIRLARNVQLILKEEAHIGKVLDPAGGSYYIESLTSQLAEQAWNRFIALQETGLEGLTEEVKANREKKEYQLAIRKTSLIGTNNYANPVEKVHSATTIPVNRLAEPYEHLRQMELKPKTGILLFGLLKEVKPRADFVSGFLNVGGISPIWSPSFSKTEEAYQWMKDEDLDYVVICAKDEDYPTIVGTLLQYKPAAIIDIAGKQEPSLLNSWIQNGLNGTIHQGQNIVEKLQDILALKKGVTK